MMHRPFTPTTRSEPTEMYRMEDGATEQNRNRDAVAAAVCAVVDEDDDGRARARDRMRRSPRQRSVHARPGQAATWSRRRIYQRRSAVAWYEASCSSVARSGSGDVASLTSKMDPMAPCAGNPLLLLSPLDLPWILFNAGASGFLA